MILETAMRNALANAFDDAVSAGYLQLETSSDVEVATFTFQDPAFGAAATGVITLAGVPISDSSATGGVVAQGSIYDGADTKLAEATAGTSAADIIMSSLTVGAGETVNLTALTVTVPTGA